MDGTIGTFDLITDGAFSLYNLTIDSAAAGNLTVEVEDALDINGTLLITDGTLDVVSGENNAITVAGNWTNNSVFVSRSGTVTFDGATQTVSGSASGSNKTFYNVNIAQAASTDDITVSGTMDVDGILNISVVDMINTGTIAVAGNVISTDDTVTGTGTIAF